MGKKPRALPPKQGNPFGALKRLRDELPSTSSTQVTSPQAGAPGTNPRAGVTPPVDRSRPRGSEEDEALALHRLAAGVTPLADKPSRLPRSLAETSGRRPEPAAARAAAAREAEEVHARLRELVEEARFEVTDDGRRVEGRRVDLPPAEVRKLRQGALPVDARLDLHGLSAADAQASLERFLADKRARGERCVLVIHGRGEHSPSGVGVLRGEIAAWLSQGRASSHVAAFATATREDGGQGALYVLLRR